MRFYGREREMAAIAAALGKDKNIILAGKFGRGKLEEELSRMSEIADNITPDSIRSQGFI